MHNRSTARKRAAELSLVVALALIAGAAARVVGKSRILVSDTSDHRAVAIFEGWFDGSPGECVRDRVFIASGSAGEFLLPGQAQEQSWCASELAVFTNDRGAVLRAWPEWAPVPGTDGTTQAETKVQTGSVLPVRLLVRVKSPPIAMQCDLPSIVVGGSESGVCGLSNALVHANNALWRARAGIVLKAALSETLTPEAESGIGKGCRSARSARRAGVYTPGVVNVNWLASQSEQYLQGEDCERYLAQEVIYIFKTAHLATLAHEVGHALGLLAPEVPGPGAPQCCGHTNGMNAEVFGDGNLMYSGVKAVGSITLGQVYRMNFDRRSWINRPVFDRGRGARVCQSDPLALSGQTINLPCPPLDLRAGSEAQ